MTTEGEVTIDGMTYRQVTEGVWIHDHPLDGPGEIDQFDADVALNEVVRLRAVIAFADEALRDECLDDIDPYAKGWVDGTADALRAALEAK